MVIPNAFVCNTNTFQATQESELIHVQLFCPRNVIDYYELMDGYIVFHFRGLDNLSKKIIHLDLKADIKGKFVAPASSAYLYYNDKVIDWEEGTEILIQQHR